MGCTWRLFPCQAFLDIACRYIKWVLSVVCQGIKWLVSVPVQVVWVITAINVKMRRENEHKTDILAEYSPNVPEGGALRLLPPHLLHGRTFWKDVTRGAKGAEKVYPKGLCSSLLRRSTWYFLITLLLWESSLVLLGQFSRPHLHGKLQDLSELRQYLITVSCTVPSCDSASPFHWVLLCKPNREGNGLTAIFWAWLKGLSEQDSVSHLGKTHQRN